MSRLSLPDVALRAVTSIAVPETIWAMERCLDEVEFGSVELLTDQEDIPVSDARIDLQRIEPIGSREDYSEFMLRGLVNHVEQAHVLVVQWDGFVIDASRWTDRFLDYDYIGAPWPQFGDGLNVGNGGFSLRSRRLLEMTAQSSFVGRHPEDVAICRERRGALERDGIRFAPEPLAEQFSFERGPRTRSFGFHGLFNFPVVLAEDELQSRLAQLDPRLLGARDGADLILGLARRGDVREAWRLAGRRRDAGAGKSIERSLLPRLAIASVAGLAGRSSHMKAVSPEAATFRSKESNRP